MKALPPSEVYEQELTFIPYKEALRKVLDVIYSQAKSNGKLLDLMCGPGYLLGQIGARRK